MLKNEIIEKLGYRLIHIWDYEWENNNDIIKEKLEEIFLNKENLIFHDDELKLDRTWFSKNQKIENYKLIKEIPPKMIKIKKFDIENCGYLVYKREN